MYIYIYKNISTFLGVQDMTWHKSFLAFTKYPSVVDVGSPSVDRTCGARIQKLATALRGHCD